MNYPTTKFSLAIVKYVAVTKELYLVELLKTS